MKPSRSLPLLALALTALLSSGCAGYRLGSMLPKDIKSVSVPTFVNHTAEPTIESETTRAVIEEFQKDGSLEVLPEGQADAQLRVTLTDYTLSPVAYRKDKRTAASEYRVTIHASVELVRTSDQSVVARHPRAKGEAVFDLAGDLSSAKRRVLPQVSEDLAHSIVETVVEAW